MGRRPPAAKRGDEPDDKERQHPQRDVTAAAVTVALDVEVAAEHERRPDRRPALLGPLEGVVDIVADEPKARVEAEGVAPGEAERLVACGRGGVDDVAVDRPQVLDLGAGVCQAEAHERDEQDEAERQGRPEGAPLGPVEAAVDDEEQDAEDGHERLAVGVRIERGRPGGDGGARPEAPAALPIAQVSPQEDGKRGGHHRRLEAGAAVEEPRRHRAKDERAGPPAPRAEAVAQRQRHGRGAGRGDERRRDACDDDALAEQGNGHEVSVHRADRHPAVGGGLEVDGQQALVGVAQAVRQQARGRQRPEGLIGVEEDREAVERVQAGDQVDDHRQGEKGDRAAIVRFANRRSVHRSIRHRLLLDLRGCHDVELPMGRGARPRAPTHIVPSRDRSQCGRSTKPIRGY